MEDVVPVADFRAALLRFLDDSEQVARAAGLTPRQLTLLTMVKGAPDRSERLTIGELADRMHLVHSSAVELVQRAEDAGLLEREPVPADARSTHVRLTAEGERRFARAFRDIEAEYEALWRAFEEVQRQRAARPE